MTTPTTTQRPANAQIIWDAITDLKNLERRVTRAVLVQATGLKPGIIDDHVERLICNDKLMRAGNGELEVLESHRPARDISLLLTTGGVAKVEIGDELLELTPREARQLSKLMAGFNSELQDIEQSNRAMVLAHELAREIKENRREIKALRAALNLDERQGRLIG
jgi:hypothetical protein